MSTIDVEPDAVLAQRAAEGESLAFEELYRRHAPAAWRVAYAVAGNPDDAADAVSDAFTRVFQVLPSGRLQSSEQFRPYLLAATRNAALDGLRRQGRLQPTATVEHLDRSTGEDVAGDQVLDSVDSSLVALAFRSLPERWRSVLWLTEVEGIPAREAAPMLGVSANGLAQLAVRARAGLRQRFLQAHVRAPVARACQFPVDKLGAYVAGGLSPRETAKVDQHLAGCADCRQQVEELEDLGSLLRRVILPVPVALGAVSLSKWKLATKLASTVGRAGLHQARKPVAAVAAAVFALGVIGITVVRNPVDRSRSPQSANGRAPNGGSNSPTVVDGFDVTAPPQAAGASRASGTNNSGTTSRSRTSRGGGTSGGGGGSGNGGGNNGNPGDGNGKPPDDGGGGGGRPQPEVLGASITANPLSTTVNAEVGSSPCAGLAVLGLLSTEDCHPPATEDPVQVRLSLLGSQLIG